MQITLHAPYHVHTLELKAIERPSYRTPSMAISNHSLKDLRVRGVAALLCQGVISTALQLVIFILVRAVVRETRATTHKPGHRCTSPTLRCSISPTLSGDARASSCAWWGYR